MEHEICISSFLFFKFFVLKMKEIYNLRAGIDAKTIQNNCGAI